MILKPTRLYEACMKPVTCKKCRICRHRTLVSDGCGLCADCEANPMEAVYREANRQVTFALIACISIVAVAKLIDVIILNLK